MNLQEIKKIPILVYANGQDNEEALEPDEIEDELILNNSICNREYCIQPCISNNGIGVVEGFKWLLDHILN